MDHVLEEYKAKEDRMKKYLGLVKELVVGFKIFMIKHISQDRNYKANRLAQLALALEDDGIMMIKHLANPSIQNLSPKKVAISENGTSWETPVMDFLMEGKLPEGQIEAQKLKL